MKKGYTGPTRDIVKTLLAAQMSVQSIANMLNLTRGAIEYHVKALRKS